MSGIMKLEDAINQAIAPVDGIDPSKFITMARLLAFRHSISEVANAVGVDVDTIRNLLATSNAFRELVDRFNDAWVREQMIKVHDIIENAGEEGLSPGQNSLLSQVVKLYKDARLEQREEKRAARERQPIQTNKVAPIVVEVEDVSENNV